MKRFALAAAVLAAFTGLASAEAQYDYAIDRAAAKIVAEKMGNLRGGFSYDQVPEFVEAVDWHPAAWKTVAH